MHKWQSSDKCVLTLSLVVKMTVEVMISAVLPGHSEFRASVGQVSDSICL